MMIKVTDCYQLEQTDGGYQRSDGVWSEYEDEYIDEDESVYSEPLSTYIYECFYQKLGDR
jgi:hypothetical protein